MSSPKFKNERVTTVELDLEAAPEAIPRRLRRRPGGLPKHLSLHRQVLVIALWPLLEQMMVSLVGFVDASLAGHLPVEAVQSTNAVGVASFVTWLMGLFQGAVGVGSTALIARAVGANHRREANAAVGQSMLVATVWGTLFGLIFYLLAPWMGRVFLQGREHELFTLYLRLLTAAAPMMSILFVGSACLRGAGDFRAPFWIMVVVNATNIFVSIWLAIGPPRMGLKGIALGTVAAWTVGGLMMLGVLLSKRAGAQLLPHRLRWQPRMIARLINVGLPSFFENVTIWGAHAVVLAIVKLMDNPDLIGAHSIAIRLEAFSFLPGFAFSMAAATMAGQYLGARDPHRAARAVWLCWAYAAGIMTTLGLLFMTVPGLFVKMVTDEQVFNDVVPALLFQAGWSQIGFATAMVISGALRGVGDTPYTMRVNLMTTLMRIPFCWLAGIHLGFGLVGIWFVLSAELMFKSLFYIARFQKGRWKDIKV